MRLENHDMKIIKDVLSEFISDAQIFLFGSRTDDKKKGGDIDLFVKTSQNISLKDELNILTQLQKNGIGRKIDLVLDTPQKNKESFFNSIKNKAVVL